MELIFEPTCTYSAQERHTMITQLLRTTKAAVIEFRKKDGTLRTMTCTTDPTLLPVTLAKVKATPIVNWELATVWDMNKASWRSFKTMNVISAKVSND